MSKVIPFHYQGQAVRFNADGWINATEAATQFNRLPNDWLRLPDTVSYIEALERTYGKISYVKTSRDHTQAHDVKTTQAKPLQVLTHRKRELYDSQVTAKSVTGFDSPHIRMAQQRPKTIVGAFFMPAMPFYGGCAWGTFGCAGVHSDRSVNLRTAATLNRLTAVRGSSDLQNGATPYV